MEVMGEIGKTQRLVPGVLAPDKEVQRNRVKEVIK